jgi:polyphosphate kinase
MFQDNVKARRLQADGTHKRRRPAKGEEPFRAQIELYRDAKRAVDKVRAASGVTLEPLTSPAAES